MTVKMIKLELKKAFTTPWFYLSLAVLMLCALMSTVYSIDSYQNIRINGFPHYFENGKMTVNEYYATWNCYQKWIGSELVSLASTLFFTLLPVCAVLPYASAFHQERKVGYLRVMLPQCGKKSYFLAKTMAVFLTGAAVVILPLVVNFLAVSAFIPATAPQVNYNFYNYVLFGDLWADLFFKPTPVVCCPIYLAGQPFRWTFGVVCFRFVLLDPQPGGDSGTCPCCFYLGWTISQLWWRDFGQALP